MHLAGAVELGALAPGERNQRRRAVPSILSSFHSSFHNMS